MSDTRWVCREGSDLKPVYCDDMTGDYGCGQYVMRPVGRSLADDPQAVGRAAEVLDKFLDDFMDSDQLGTALTPWAERVLRAAEGEQQ